MAVPVLVFGHNYSRHALQACSTKHRSALHAISERPDLQTAAERLAEEIEAESVPEETADEGRGVEDDAQLQVQLLALQHQVTHENLCCVLLSQRWFPKDTLLSEQCVHNFKNQAFTTACAFVVVRLARAHKELRKEAKQ